MNLQTIFNSLIDLIFPPRCVVCKKFSNDPLCGDCLSKVKYIDPLVCKVCGEPHNSRFEGNFCHDCYQKKTPFDIARSITVYEGVMKEAIHEFKFNNKRTLSVPLGKIMIDYLKNNKEIGVSDVDIIIPVPLSRKKQRAREYDQAELLAEELSKYNGIELDIGSLKRTRETIPQFKLSRKERLVNLKEAFSALSTVEGKNILLVDDIYTTGSTAKEASIALKKAGAGKVYVLTLARAVI